MPFAAICEYQEPCCLRLRCAEELILHAQYPGDMKLLVNELNWPVVVTLHFSLLTSSRLTFPALQVSLSSIVAHECRLHVSILRREVHTPFDAELVAFWT